MDKSKNTDEVSGDTGPEPYEGNVEHLQILPPKKKDPFAQEKVDPDEPPVPITPPSDSEGDD